VSIDTIVMTILKVVEALLPLVPQDKRPAVRERLILSLQSQARIEADARARLAKRLAKR
jgi:hypothetical protein